MSERQKVMNQTSWAMRKIIDLRDMLDDGVPMSMQKNIRDQILMLEDIVFHNQEYLESLKSGT